MAQVTMKQIWGLAKSPELSMTDEELHLLVERETGKTSMKELTAKERNRMLYVLIKLKDPETDREKKLHHHMNDIMERQRYDRFIAKGDPARTGQRKKIYMTAMEMGWRGDRLEKSLRSLCVKMFGVSDVSFLSYSQCSALIEALKSMKERKEQEDGKSQTVR